MKNVLYLSLVLLISVSACKKDNSQNMEETGDNTILPAELDGYYIVSEDKHTANATTGLLTVFYFVFSGENVHVTRDAPGQNRLIQRLQLPDNVFRFETANHSYSFTLNKEQGGDLQLTNYSYLRSDNPESGIVYAQIYKRADVPAFLDKTFKDMDSQQSFLIVTTDGKYKWHESPNFGNITNDYFNLRNFGWKATGRDYYGIMVNHWKHYNHPVMLMHSELGNVLRIFREL